MPRPRTILREGFLFSAFLLAYYAPILVDLAGSPLFDPSVRPLLREALDVAEVRLEIVRNLLAHFFLAALFFAALGWAAGRTAAVLGVSRTLWRIALLCIGCVLLVSLNGVLFPLSNYSVPLQAIVSPVVAACAGTVVAGVVLLALAYSGRALLFPAALGLGLLSLAAVGAVGPSGGSGVAARNVVILGIDSLSPQTLGEARDALPGLSGMMSAALRFERAYTPLGRTFPAWISLLSGRPPAEHGAILNLRGGDRVVKDDLVTHALAAAGYRTVLAMDERRFANIDESYGFDEIVGPKAGVLDFVLQRANDTPLTNLFLQSSLSRFVLPYSRLNAASYANYDAKGFVDETVSALESGKSNFLAVHFESAHFPFRSRHAAHMVRHSNEFVARHLTALTVVDAQVVRLIDALGRRGYLDDALVVVVSDHGESLGDVEASTTRGGVPFDVSGYGHGFDVVSERQNRVLLGLVQFRDGEPVGASRAVRDQVSLTDVRSAIERYVATGVVQLTAAHECMFVETGLRPVAVRDYGALDERAVAAEAMRHYRIDDQGRVQLREESARAIVGTKDVGWRCGNRLTYYSRSEDRYFAYRLLDDGSRLIEDIALAGDIERIEAYRRRSFEAAAR